MAFNARIDIESVEEGLKGIQTNMARVRRRALQVAAQSVRKAVRQGISLSTRRKTGELLRAYRYKVKKDASSVSVFPKGSGQKTRVFPKALTLSWGSPKTRHVPRGFVQRGQAAADEGAYMEEIEKKVVEKEILKYWEG